MIDAELMTLWTIPDPVILDLSNEIFLPVQALIKRIRTNVKSYVGDGVTGHLAVIAKFGKALFLADDETTREVENLLKGLAKQTYQQF